MKKEKTNDDKYSVYRNFFFFSIQGEGRYMGVPSVFLRTFGCNFRCKSFGRRGEDFVDPAEKYNPDVIPVIERIDEYHSFEQLPIVSTGCDTYSSIYPEFRHLAKQQTVDEIAQEIVQLLPQKKWLGQHLIFTGGEPLLKGWQQAYIELLQQPEMAELKNITFETNGTQTIKQPLADFLQQWQQQGGAVTFSVSAKLSCSGELREKAIKPDVVNQYQSLGDAFLKLVVATEQDVQEALEVIDIYRATGFEGDVYLMPVGGDVDEYELNKTTVAELALQHGLRYSDRLQVPLFKNRWGT